MTVSLPVSVLRILGTRKSQTVWNNTPNYTWNILASKTASVDIHVTREHYSRPPQVEITVTDSTPLAPINSVAPPGQISLWDRCKVIITTPSRVVSGLTEIGKTFVYSVWCDNISVSTRGVRVWHLSGYQTAANSPIRYTYGTMTPALIGTSDAITGLRMKYPASGAGSDGRFFLNTNSNTPNGIGTPDMLEMYALSCSQYCEWWQDPATPITDTGCDLILKSTNLAQTAWTLLQLGGANAQLDWGITTNDCPSWYVSNGTYNHTDQYTGSISGSHQISGRVCDDYQGVTAAWSWYGYRDTEAEAISAFETWTASRLAVLAIPRTAIFPTMSLRAFHLVKDVKVARDLMKVAIDMTMIPRINASAATWQRYTIADIRATIRQGQDGTATMVLDPVITVTR